MIKALIFDLGGVIIFNDLNNLLKTFAEELKIDFELLKKIEADNHEKLILGKISIKEFCSAIRGRFGLEYESDIITLMWERNYNRTVKTNDELLKKILELKKKYKIALVSNIFDDTARFHQRQKIFYYFKPVLLSCRVGLAKPDIKIFARAISELGVEGKECLFIDDDASFLDAAKEFGMKIIHFKNNKQLFKEMRKLKVMK